MLYNNGEHVTCHVKWFNNQKGWGFLTYPDDPTIGDIFVHYLSIEIPSKKRKLGTNETVRAVLEYREEKREWRALRVIKEVGAKRPEPAH